MIRIWKKNNNKYDEIHLDDQSSLDSITRQLPGGYYSTFRTYGSCTRVLGLKQHIQRLPDVNASSLRRHLFQLLEPYRPDEARVRLILTSQGQLYIAIEYLKLLDASIYERGVCAETTEIQRKDPRIKSTSFISVSDGERKLIAKAGVFEALLIRRGKIVEGMTSNFFYVIDNTLFTAQKDILLGVTRRNVLRVARKAQINIIYKPLKLQQMGNIDEAFITSSSRGIVPVIEIDGQHVGRGAPGKITLKLMSAYQDYVLWKAENI